MKESGKNYIGFEDCTISFIGHMFASLFPNYYGEMVYKNIATKEMVEENLAMCDLQKALGYVTDDSDDPESLFNTLKERLKDVRELLNTDIQAAYEGDPAAKDFDEIILAYPAFKAIFIYRIAHELYLLKVPILPRVMTEYAHRLTGIDIHPGATIGRYFFIDHGTGVVIGETTVIGEHVKLYQHVTLGAKSFQVGEDGALVKGIKRHPNIGDYVVIYAGATILGGNTYIGDRAVIGSSAWVTHSVPAGETITIKMNNYE